MTTATLQTASEVEVFRHQVQVIHEVLRLNVAGLTYEESLIQPSPAGSCLNWVVGHLLCIYEKAISMLGQETVMEEGAP